MADKTWSSLNKGAYSAETAYTVGDFVSYQGGYYTCIQNTTGNAPIAGEDTAYWKLVADKGDTGDTGTAATIAVGTVTTLDPGESATVANSGSESAATFDFGIPKGETGATGATGTSFTWKGDWSSATAYAVRDVVYRLGSSYICIEAHTNQEPPNVTYWELVAQKGTDGEGAGDVIGPASSVTNRIAAFDGLTGKLLKDGGKTIAEVEAASIPATYLDTDTSLTANSDTKVATQKATKAYADTKSSADKVETLTNKTMGDDLDFDSNKAINLADPTSDQDAATKAYVDANGGADWKSAGETWEYVSTDDPTGVFRVNADVTTKYSAGMRIKFVNATNTIYGIITVVSSYGAVDAGYTHITFLHEIDPTDSQALYLMANSAITANYYSTHKVPFGFPLDLRKWSVKYEQATTVEQTSPTSGVWYNLGGSLVIPIGAWKVSYRGAIRAQNSTGTNANIYSTLSTANNSESDADLSTYNILAGLVIGLTINVSKNLLLTSKTTYYFNVTELTADTITHIRVQGAQGKAIIKAECAYL